MSKLREQMQMDLDIKGYSPQTKRSYIGQVERFSRYYGKSPDKLGEQEIKEYLHYLIKIRKLSSSHINIAYSALKFFYNTTLHREWDIEKIPRIKNGKTLPRILSQEEVTRLLQATSNLKHRAMLMTIYGAGLRVSETANLKLGDIDSKRMQIHIYQGKGKKDRYTILSEANLSILRKYWELYRPDYWMFPGVPKDKPISTRTIQKLFQNSRVKVGIKKQVSVHSLRHSFATHLLEFGVDIYHIQKLMGHSSIKTTSIYIHLKRDDILNITSPLDMILDIEK